MGQAFARSGKGIAVVISLPRKRIWRSATCWRSGPEAIRCAWIASFDNPASIDRRSGIDLRGLAKPTDRGLLPARVRARANTTPEHGLLRSEIGAVARRMAW